MRVTYQDCGCIALPDEIVDALGLSAGSILNLSFDVGSKVLSITALDTPEGGVTGAPGASCRIRTDSK